MALTEQDRIKLYRHFEADMGEELATKMMDSLPPAGWGDVATKQDIEDLRVATKKDIEDLRLATKKDIEDLRLATKKDIDHAHEITDLKLEHWAEKFDLKLEKMEERIMRHMERGFKVQTFALVTAMSLVGTAARLF